MFNFQKYTSEVTKMTKSIMKKILPLFVLFLIATFAFADTFNANLSSEERTKLDNREVLIRNIGKARKISLNPINDTAASVINEITKLKPPYLVEIIQKVPYEGNENLLDTLKAELLNVEDYVNIPYFGERTGQWYQLYSYIEVLSKNESASKTEMNVKMLMSPFDIIPTALTITQTENELLYSSVNTEPVKIKDSGVKIVDGMTCAKTEKMKSFVYAFRDGDSIILYGIGGVDAPNVPILKKKIDNSFINRVTTFCKYIFDKL